MIFSQHFGFLSVSSHQYSVLLFLFKTIRTRGETWRRFFRNQERIATFLLPGFRHLGRSGVGEGILGVKKYVLLLWRWLSGNEQAVTVTEVGGQGFKFASSIVT
jgi:hypothetical protein